MKKRMYVVAMLFTATLLLLLFSVNNRVNAEENKQQKDNIEWICPNCGNVLTTNFCPDCGTKKPVIVSDNTSDNELSTYKSYTIDLSEEKLYETLSSWMGAKYKEVKPILEANGFTYQGKDEKWEGNAYMFVATEHSFDITLFDQDEDGIVEFLEAIFVANAKAYNTIYDSLVKKYGTPVFNREGWNYSEMVRWLSSDMVEYRLCGDVFTQSTNKNEHDRGTLSQVKAGKHNFQLLLIEANGPLWTDKPITTPAPTSRIVSEISIVSTKLKSSSVVPELFIIFQNNSSTPVDRIDFDVKCYDAYGVTIKSYGYYDWSSCFYDATTIKKGQKTRSDYRWYMTGYDGIKEVEIAVTRYHKTDGTVIKIPDDQLDWKRFHY